MYKYAAWLIIAVVMVGGAAVMRGPGGMLLAVILLVVWYVFCSDRPCNRPDVGEEHVT